MALSAIPFVDEMHLKEFLEIPSNSILNDEWND